MKDIYEYVEIGPGVRVGVKYTKAGRVVMLAPGGELDVTDGSLTLAFGLIEAGKRAVQLRLKADDRARRRKERAK